MPNSGDLDPDRNPDPEAEFSLEEWPFFWLIRASGRYGVTMEGALKKCNLDLPRWRVLMVLKELESASVSQIADRAISKLPTMMKIVQRMQADGLVDLQSRVSDGRVTEVRLTQAGRNAAGEAWIIAQIVSEKAFSAMTRAEENTLIRLLRKLSNGLSQEIL